MIGIQELEEILKQKEALIGDLKKEVTSHISAKTSLESLNYKLYEENEKLRKKRDS